MYNFTDKLLKKNNIIILDGATGTELEKNGVKMDPVCWTGLAGYTDPHILELIHEKYILAGSNVITTNTFSSSRINIEYSDKKLDIKKINYNSIDCAINVRNKHKRLDIKIAGSMSLSFIKNRYEYPLSKSIGTFSYEHLLENYREQANFFVEKKIDLIILEMVSHPETAKAMMQAAIESGLPIWLGICAGPVNDEGNVLAYEAKNILLKDVLKLISKEIEAVLIMHTEVKYIDNCLKEIREYYDGIVGAYPHKGYFKKPNWFHDDKYTPKIFYTDMLSWINKYDLKIIGGCCGINHKHIKYLYQKIN